MSYNFLVRLRADESGITDLAGNIWNVGSGIKLGTGLLSDTKKSIVFGGDSNSLLTASINNSLGDGDFTFSCWCYLENVYAGIASGGGVTLNTYHPSGR